MNGQESGGMTSLQVLNGPLDRLEQAIGPLVAAFTNAGHRFYVVGGWVRDLLLAAHPQLASPGLAAEHTGLADPLLSDPGLSDPGLNDIDITTDARPADIEKLLAEWGSTIWTAGIAFGTVGASNGSCVVEVTTHRGEHYQQGSRKPTVEFSDDIETDLSRRDFTVNALAIELPSRRFVDPFNGLDDLQQRVLRAPGNPEQLFGEDPLRILRAGRFVAGLSLEPTPEVVVAMASTCERLAIVSPERISMELQKLLTLPRPGAGVALLEQIGALAFLGITTAGNSGASATGGSVTSAGAGGVQADTLATAVDAAAHAEMDAAVDKTGDKTGDKAADKVGEKTAIAKHETRWAALAYLGGHDSKGAGDLLGSLRYSKEVRNNVAATLAALHALSEAALGSPDQASAGQAPATQAAVARRLLATHNDYLHAAAAVDAALTAANAPDYQPIAPALLSEIRRIKTAEGVPRMGKPLDGKAVVAIARFYGVELVGEQIGAALTYLLECHYREGPLASKRAETLLMSNLRSRERTGQPSPSQLAPTQPVPAQPAPAQPVPSQPVLAQPAPAQPSPAPRTGAAAQNTAIRKYLEALRLSAKKEKLKARIATINAELPTATILKRIDLVQEEITLSDRLADHFADHLELRTAEVAMAAVEAEFIKHAKKYSQRKGVSYSDWTKQGVPTDLLKQADITP